MLYKWSIIVKESIHVVFDETDNVTLIEGITNLNLYKHFDDTPVKLQ